MELAPSVARSVASWTCPVCLREIIGSRQICLHEARLGRGNCVRPVCVPIATAAVPIATAADRIEVPIVPIATAAARIEVPVVPIATAAARIEVPVVTTGIIARERFCRRPKHEVEPARMPRPSSPLLQMGSRDMVSVQDAWLQYLDNVADQFSPEFWKFFCEIHDQSTSAIDAALRGVKKCFITPEHQRQKMFASSKRQLFKRISSQVCVTFETHLRNHQ